MKIKLALLDNDKNYLNRISAFFSNKYSDKVEIYSFTDADMAMDSLEACRIDVFVASDVFDIDLAKLPSRCGFAYLTENQEVISIKEQHTVARYQRIDLFYRQVLDLYSEKAALITGFRQDNNSDLRIITFLSAAGGTGSSTMAIAFAKCAAGRGKKVLYLDFEQFGYTGCFLSGIGQAGFSDVIYAIKSKKSNLALKLESTVRQDESGVYFYESPQMALDFAEFDEEELKTLLGQFSANGDYDYIVIDIDLNFDKKTLEIITQSSRIVFVSDGSGISNKKTGRAYNAFLVLEEQQDMAVSQKSVLIYNKFSSKTSAASDNPGLKCIGGVPWIEGASVKQITDKISSMQVFESLFS